jgi:hypothetical protein
MGRTPPTDAEYGRPFMKKLILAGLTVSMLVASGFALAGPGNAERIAVAANGQTVASSVANQAGRSAFFLVFDEKGGFVPSPGKPVREGAECGNRRG